MRIAHIGQPFDAINPPVESGSVALWIYEVARRQARHASVRIFARSAPGDALHERHERIELTRHAPGRTGRAPQLLHRLLGRPAPDRPFYSSPFYAAAYLRAIIDELRRRPCDVVHVQNFSQYLPALRAALPHAVLVLHMGCEWLLQLDRAMLRRRLRHADVIGSCSDYLSSLTARRFPDLADRCRTIANGVDVQRFAPPAEGAPERQPLILFVGRVSPEKGVHDLVSAVAELRRDRTDVRLEVVGPIGALPREFLVDCSDDPRVRRLATYYGSDYLEQLRGLVPPGSDGAIHFAGKLPHTQLPEHYGRAAVLVNPALSEAFGRSVIEGLACATPVVASRVGGMVELLEDGAGVLVEPGDPSALAAVLRDLMADPERRRRMGEAGRRTVEQGFSWDQITMRTLQLYERVAADRRRRAV